MVPPNQPFQRGFATYETSSYWATPMFLRPILDRSSLPSLDAACSSQMNWYVIVSVCQHIFLKFVRLCFSKKIFGKSVSVLFFSLVLRSAFVTLSFHVHTCWFCTMCQAGINSVRWTCCPKVMFPLFLRVVRPGGGLHEKCYWLPDLHDTPVNRNIWIIWRC